MIRHTILVVTICSILPGTLRADDMPPAGRPWFAVCIASLSQLHQDIDALLVAADQPELADVLGQRLERWKNLAGVDRTRPVGLVRFWPHQPGASPEEVLFIPATDRDKFMKTATFGVVEFTRQASDHYVIDRPLAPYHVLFRNDNVAWMGDRTQTLLTCSGLFRDWTRELVSRNDVGVFWDLRQIPESSRRAAAESWRQSVEPLLQRRDGESKEMFALRSGWSAPVLTASSLAIEQTQRVVAHVRFDKERSSAVVDVDLIAEAQSDWHRVLKSWHAARSPWQALSEEKDVRGAGFIAGLPAVQWPGQEQSSPLGEQLAWQVFGDSNLDRVAVLAVSDGPVQPPDQKAAIRNAAPREYRRVRVPDLPNWLRRWINGYPEAWFVRENGVAWLGFGPEELARTRLDAAIDLKPSQDAKKTPVCLSARIPLGECLDAIPWIERMWMEQQLVDHEDRIELTVTPTSDGLHFRAVLPVGVLRIIGGIIADDLAQEADRLFAAPPP